MLKCTQMRARVEKVDVLGWNKSEAGPSCWFAFVDHQMQVDPTNVTLEVSHLPTYLPGITVLILYSCRLEIHVYLCEIPTQIWIGTLETLGFFVFFAKLENWISSATGLPILPLASYLLLSIANWFWCVAGLMLASPAYLQWVGLYLRIWLEIRSWNVQKSTMFLSFHVYFLQIKVNFISNN